MGDSPSTVAERLVGPKLSCGAGIRIAPRRRLSKSGGAAANSVIAIAPNNARAARPAKVNINALVNFVSNPVERFVLVGIRRRAFAKSASAHFAAGCGRAPVGEFTANTSEVPVRELSEDRPNAQFFRTVQVDP